MKINFMPKTNLGKWSFRLILAFIVFLGIFYLFVYLGLRGGDTFFSNPGLAIPISLAGISAIASLVTGIISVIKDKEKAIVVFLSIIIGVFVTLFILGELLFPH
jgi:hypothetical protein